MDIYLVHKTDRLMVIWSDVKDAARYYVHLSFAIYNDSQYRTLVDEIELSSVEVERNKKYHTFLDILYVGSNHVMRYAKENVQRPYYSYNAFVEAEDKNGNIIEKSEKYDVGCLG